MDSWVWLLIGFVAGLVVAAIFSLIFRKDPTEELEQVADDRGAQLSKAEMKAAVLQDKLLEAEAAQEEQRLRLEADCQEQLAAAEAEYGRKFDLLEKQFDDLELAFAAQREADEKEKMEAAALAAAALLAADAAEQERTSEVEDADSELYDALDEAFAEEALLEEEQGGDSSTDETEVGEGPQEVAHLEEPDPVDAAILAAGTAQGVDGTDTLDDLETAGEPVDSDDDPAGAMAKMALAAAAAAMASAATGDEEELEQEPTAAGQETVEPEAQTAELPLDDVDAPGDEQQEGGTVLAAAAAGTTAAALTDSDDDDDEPTVQADLDEQEEPGLLDEITGSEQEIPAAETLVAGASLMGEEESDDRVDEAGQPLPEPEEEPEPEPAEPPWPEDTSTWQGEYFNNMKMEGDPVLEREDPEINFDWGLGSPAPEVNVDAFSARWTRTADLQPGRYLFTVTSDDGVRLWVDDRLVISAWYDHTEMTFRREMELPGGLVDLRVEYYDNEMAALVRVKWELIS